MFSLRVPACLMLIPALMMSCQEQEPEDDGPVVVTTVPGGSEFALDLYKRIAAEHEGENLFFSPFSVRSALAMTWEGARGETADQMADALRLPDLERSEVHASLGSMARSMYVKGKPYEFNIANAVWVDQTLPLVDAYVQQITGTYAAGLKQADFMNQPESERGKINRWVEDQTNERIKDLMPKGTVTDDTRLVLANAIYFKGQWAEQFSPYKTRDEVFTLADGSEVLVPMMERVDSEIARASGKDFWMIELPYVGDELSMIILVPGGESNLPELQGTLTAEVLKGVIAELRVREVGTFQMPRFKIAADSYSLRDTLRSMGMDLAFDQSRADFTGLILSGGGMFIAQVMHKGFIEVNEEGTEAAAATGIQVEAASEEWPLVVNRPFLFLIRHKPTGEILFMGRVLDPRAQ